MTILNTSITNENANHQPYTGIRTLGAGTYDYQLDVRAKFEGSAYNILTMPSGSGKSFVQAALAVLDISTVRERALEIPLMHCKA
jgi:hypothetical protein